LGDPRVAKDLFPVAGKTRNELFGRRQGWASLGAAATSRVFIRPWAPM